MKKIEIFTAALELQAPWYVEDVQLSGQGKDKELHIYVNHERRKKFKYDSEEYPVYDHQKRTWKHLNFFQHACFIHASVPRVKTKEEEVRLIEVPWAKPGSSFTLLFEQDVLKLIEEGMSASAVARRLNIGSKRVFGVVRRYVSHALATQDIEIVKELSVDETSSRKGHNYLTILADREAKKVVGVAVGKDKDAVAHALIDMEVRGGDRTKVKSVTMDMSRSYISATDEYMPKAAITFDRYHISALLNKAVDEIRRRDQRQYDEIKNSRYLWLRSHQNLNEEQKERIDYLGNAYPNIGKAYRLKELLKQVLDDAHESNRLTPLNQWMKEAWATGLEPLRKFVDMLRDHWYGVKEYFKKVATNAYAERLNLKIQEIKRLAKGYRNTHNFMMMIYFHLGGLDLKTH